MTTPPDLDKLPPAGDDELPRVYFKTLGTFDVMVKGIQWIWESSSAGAQQLKRGVAFLLLRHGHPVRRDDLARATGGHGEGDRRNVIAAVVKLLETWGLGGALKLHRPHITFLRHPSWSTDTDRLEALRSAAKSLEQDGQIEHAIYILREAANLCDGNYLPLFPANFDETLKSRNARWRTVQKQVLQSLARLCLDTDDEDNHWLAFDIAFAAIPFDLADPKSYRLVAQAARRCGNSEIARQYEEVARVMEQEASGDP